uniref:Uncharacterized protein n=1 Tax=Knipowitschia caucasica TaxID=637954 RepID=A0AAV2LGH6_KNICA
MEISALVYTTERLPKILHHVLGRLSDHSHTQTEKAPKGSERLENGGVMRGPRRPYTFGTAPAPVIKDFEGFGGWSRSPFALF